MPSNTSLVMVLMIGACCWANDRVSSKEGRIILEESPGRSIELTHTGFDSDPWLSPDGHLVVFIRHSPEDVFRTSVYEIDVDTRTPKHLYSGPAKYQGRESSYFGRPELNESLDTLFLISKEYATEGALLAVDLVSGEVRLISDHVVGYDVIACSQHPQYRGDLITLKRHQDILKHPYFLYWLYSPSGKELRLAGGGELDEALPDLRDRDCEVPEFSSTAPSIPSTLATAPAKDAISVDGSVMQDRLIKRVEPIYPSPAQSRHIQGDVHLLVRIAADGTIQDVNLVSGPPQLVAAAMAAVKQWRYRPMMSSGHAVPVVTNVKIPFRLPSSDK